MRHDIQTAYENRIIFEYYAAFPSYLLKIDSIFFKGDKTAFAIESRKIVPKWNLNTS